MSVHNVRDKHATNSHSTGTLGLYRAMQMLGYTPYHMKEICFEGGVPHMKMARGYYSAA